MAWTSLGHAMYVNTPFKPTGLSRIFGPVPANPEFNPG